MKHRSRTDIISQILDTANGGGATKPKILYEACLSHNELKEYLTVLTQSELLIYDVETHTFMTPKKVFSFLKPTIRFAFDGCTRIWVRFLGRFYSPIS